MKLLKKLVNVAIDILKVDKSAGAISVRNPNGPPDEPPKVYTFDHVFGDDSKQLDIYNLIARPIVDAVLEGYNGTNLSNL